MAKTSTRAATGLVILTALACSHAPSYPVRQGLVPSLVAISVPNLDDTVRWYHDVLGFDVEKQSAFPDYHLRLAMLVRDEVHLELIELEGSKAPSEILPGFDNPALLQGFGKLGFSVHDAARLASELARKGARFQLSLRDDPETRSRTFIILDNNGNWLEFSEPLPPSGLAVPRQ